MSIWYFLGLCTGAKLSYVFTFVSIKHFALMRQKLFVPGYMFTDNIQYLRASETRYHNSTHGNGEFFVHQTKIHKNLTIKIDPSVDVALGQLLFCT
jgi:hypothetical protein